MKAAAVFNDEKVELHRNIKDIERKLGNPNVKLESFILSVSKYEDIKEACGNIKNEEFEKNHILFLEDGDVIEKLLQKLI
jgi:3-methyladenine DNA glycosylase/8-oxoguanine DNA glycosylase